MKRFTRTKPFITFLLAFVLTISTLLSTVAPAPGVAAAASTPEDLISQPITKAVNYINGSGGANTEWLAVDFGRVGNPVASSYPATLKTSIATICAAPSPSATDLERYALAATALHIDVTDVDGCNLIAKIYNYSGGMTIYGYVFGLLALDSGYYTVPDDAKWTRSKLVDAIISGLASNKYPSGDLYGMALSALAAYKDQDKVKTAGETAVAWLVSNLDNSSSESIAQAIVGLSSFGIDPADAKFNLNGKNLIERLLAFQNADGGFKHLLTGTNSDRSISTEQALRGLYAYRLYTNGGGNLYVNPDFKKVQTSVTIEGPTGPIGTSSITQAVYALDALQNAAAQNNIAVGITDSSFGKYVSSINGISAGSIGDYSGWMYAIKRNGEWISPDVGAAAFKLQTADEVYFYFSDGTALVNAITVTPAAPKTGEAIAVNVTKVEWVWDNTTYTSNKVVSAAANVQVKLGSQTVNTGSNGTAAFTAPSAGAYSIEVTGYVAGSAPTIVRATSALTVAPAEQKVQASVKIEGPTGPVGTSSVTQAVYAMDALQNAAAQNNVAVGITDSSFGKYVSSINGISAGSIGEYSGWMYAIKRNGEWISPDVGADQFVLEASDEVYFYFSDGTPLVDTITVAPVAPKTGDAITINVKKAEWVWDNTTYTSNKVVSNAANVQVKLGDQTVTTDSNGTAAFTAPSAGTYTIEVSGYVAGSVPTIVRATSPLTVAPAVTVPDTSTITLSVNGDPIKGTILSSRSVALQEGDTAYSVLVRTLGADKVVASGSGASIYVQAIDGLAEFDRGLYSGWLYTVNGNKPNVSAGAYTLTKGSTVVWRYTTDYRTETGSSESGSGGTGSDGTTAAIPTEVSDALAKIGLTADNKLPLGQAGQATAVLHATSRMTASEAAEWAKKLAAAPQVALSQKVTAAGESTLADQAGKVKFIVPAAALSTDTTIAIAEQTSNRPELVSSVFDFTPDGTKFNKPVYLSFRVPLLIDNLSNLTLVWLDKSTNQWIPVPAVIDAKTGVITGKVTHFTSYAVVDSSKVQAQSDELKQLKDAITATVAKALLSNPLSDWEAIGVAGSGATVPTSYLQAVTKTLTDAEGSFRKVTDYERIALAVKAAGGDPTAVAGYNLIEKIYNNESLTAQGTNGAIFALIAMDSGNFTVPANAKWSRDALVKWLLTQQNKDGGFPLTSGDDSGVDMTAMAITALSGYQDRAEVKAAIALAVTYLSAQQLSHGGYASYGEDSSESVAQVIVALASVGISPKDARFVKSGGDLLSRLNAFRQADGSYAHTTTGGSNSMATEQALLALDAYKQYLTGGSKLYDFTASVPATPDEVTFVDESSIAAWASAAVHQAFQAKLMLGVSATELRFAPKQQISRAQFATLVLRLIGETPQSGAKSQFSDVSKDAWYYDAIMTAKAKGIISGVTADTFKPNEAVSRQDMAVMLARAFKLDGTSSKTTFKDQGHISSYALASVRAVYDQGIMVGSAGSFDAASQVTREMAAVVSVNLQQKHLIAS